MVNNNPKASLFLHFFSTLSLSDPKLVILNFKVSVLGFSLFKGEQERQREEGRSTSSKKSDFYSVKEWENRLVSFESSLILLTSPMKPKRQVEKIMEKKKSIFWFQVSFLWVLHGLLCLMSYETLMPSFPSHLYLKLLKFSFPIFFFFFLFPGSVEGF